MGPATDTYGRDWRSLPLATLPRLLLCSRSTEGPTCLGPCTRWPQVIHDAAGATTVTDMTLVDVNRPEAVDTLLAQAMEKRCACTAHMRCSTLLCCIVGNMQPTAQVSLAPLNAVLSLLPTSPFNVTDMSDVAPCPLHRSVGCTTLNEQSSRSHMVFALRIEGNNTNTGVKVRGGGKRFPPPHLLLHCARARGLAQRDAPGSGGDSA